LRQQASQALQIQRTAEAAVWLQFGRIAESRNQVRIDVRIVPARPIEVSEQPASMTPADDFADHREISQPVRTAIEPSLGDLVPGQLPPWFISGPRSVQR
jgi:hypothetical protein